MSDVEKALIEEKMEEFSNQDPQAVAAGLFGLYLPRFRALVWSLSSKARARVLTALIESPLQEAPFNFSSQQEKDCFAIGETLLQAKFMMVQATFMENNEVLRDATSEPVEPSGETPVEKQGE